MKNGLKINEKESRVLRFVENNALADIASIASATGLKTTAVQYLLRTLKDRGVLGAKRAHINKYRLGLCDFTLYFSLGGENDQGREELLQQLVNSPLVTWITELGGSYQYAAAVYATSVIEVRELFDQINTQQRSHFIRKMLSVRTDRRILGRAYLAPDIPCEKEFTAGGHCVERELKETDRVLISHLGNNPFYSIRALSRELGMPFSTVERSLHRLEEDRIISGYYYLMNLDALGVHVYKLNISVRGLTNVLSKELLEFSREQPRVVNFIECIGEWDFELTLEAASPQAIRPITSALYERFGDHLTTVASVPILDFVKYSTVPLGNW